MKQLKNNTIGVISIFISSVFYAICIPCTKLLEMHISSVFLGGLLYFGAGLGMFFISLIKNNQSELSLKKRNLPYLTAMVLLDISAIIALTSGISMTTAANASLLLNFELAATTLVAFYIFKEFISKKAALAIVLIFISSMILSFEKHEYFAFNLGSLLVLLSAIFWGIENNCTKMLSSKDTIQITAIKGLFSGLGSFFIAYIIKENIPEFKYILIALFLGFLSYGVSVALYIYAQRFLGASKTGALYSATPFLGVIFSFLILKENPEMQFYIALLIMIFASILILRDTQNS